ncbi:MAG TPA: CRISPR-associated endonuclease Cas3'', partial [bacterium]|nr:CRISPR-associated endonuclease Cas3'' [bacterium]
MKYFARENQELSIHLENTANLTKDFARFFDCENLGYSIGILHDLGKYTDTFQDYLQRAIRGEKTIRGEIIHSLQGAKFVAEKISDTLIADILGNIIAAHHNGLFDTINDGERTLTIKTNKSEDILHYDEAIKNFCPNIDTQKIENEIRNFCKKCIDKKLMPLFMMHLLTKILYSCL